MASESIKIWANPWSIRAEYAKIHSGWIFIPHKDSHTHIFPGMEPVYFPAGMGKTGVKPEKQVYNQTAGETNGLEKAANKP